jgi:hypothetical protein
MKFSIDRTLRVIWLMIGSLLLVFLVAGSIMVLAQVIGNAGASREAVRVARDSTAPRQEVRAVRYGSPESIRGTDTRLVMVGYGEGHEPRGAGFSGSYGMYDGNREPQVNIVFLDEGGARLLVDRPAFIHDVRYPEPATRPGSSDSLQTWISYVIAIDDSGASGRLDERDPPGLYVTDRDGRGLRAVLRPPLRYLEHEVLDATRMLVYALEPPAGQAVARDRMRQRAFIYDVAADRLSPYAALDSAAARAGQILAR